MNKQFLRIFLFTRPLICLFTCLSICLFSHMPALMNAGVFARQSSDDYKATMLRQATNTDKAIDTSTWLTYPIGRYLVKLPPFTKIQRKPLNYQYDYNLTWEKDFTIQEGNTLLKNKYFDLVKDETLHVEYKENMGPEGLGSLLAYSEKKDPDTGQAGSIKYEMYVVNNKPIFDPDFEQRVYFFQYSTAGGFESSLFLSDDEILDYKKNETNFVHMLANNIWASDRALPLDTRNGVYFEGGFLHTPADLHKLFEHFAFRFYESADVECTFPEYPQRKLFLTSAFYFYSLSADAKKHTFTKHDAISIKDETREVVADGGYRYTFTPFATGLHIVMAEEMPEYIEERGQAYTLTPFITGLHLYMRGFDKDSKNLWDAIKATIRWRPDGVHVPLPKEANGRPYFVIYDKIIPTPQNPVPSSQ